ncbi:tripartite tricarboxylate transporter substrate-binding protein [Rhodoferax sediminis]|uniref:tripartite tricarboxylate transporter substrate-binding protein n=1 Tax=Rhodoferax sediminis TaxID=2509614 RepID=UPI00143DE033|nr:tripartite tricarboxylate transporter substrate-binding protein [Rhodoferax sediminis]
MIRIDAVWLNAGPFWNSYLVPADTPAAVVDRLYKGFAHASANPAVHERLAKVGVMIKARNGVETGKFVHSEIVRWRG